MSGRFTKVLADLAPMTPFVGPETLERRRGRAYKLRLGANESAFGPSPKVLAALQAAAGSVSWYCDPEHFDLRSKLAAQLDVAVENLVIGEGIDGLLGLIVRAFADPGDPVVTSAGAYPTFNYHVLGYGARLDFVPYTAAWENDVEALAARARERGAKLLYLADPDNPTGTFLGRAAVAALLERLPDGCLLVLDEAYAEFAPPEQVPPIDPDDPRLIRLRTFSKAHGLAGLRVGYAIASQEIVAAFDRIRLHFGVGRLSQIAAAAALDDPDFAAAVVRQVAEGRRDYEALARGLGLWTIPSRTNFVGIDLASARAAERLAALLDQADVFVRRPGVPPLDRLIRITVGTPAERAALAPALRTAMAALGGG
jgi:histidinol-phosphate aminotransferase